MEVTSTLYLSNLVIFGQGSFCDSSLLKGNFFTIWLNFYSGQVEREPSHNSILLEDFFPPQTLIFGLMLILILIISILRTLILIYIDINFCLIFWTLQKDGHGRCWNLIMRWNKTVSLLYGWLLQNISLISKNASNKSCTELNFLQETQCTRISIYPWVELEGSKDFRFWNIIMCWNEKVHFRAKRCKNYRLYWKMLQTKVAQN